MGAGRRCRDTQAACHSQANPDAAFPSLAPPPAGGPAWAWETLVAPGCPIQPNDQNGPGPVVAETLWSVTLPRGTHTTDAPRCLWGSLLSLGHLKVTLIAKRWAKRSPTVVPQGGHVSQGISQNYNTQLSGSQRQPLCFPSSLAPLPSFIPATVPPRETAHCSPEGTGQRCLPLATSPGAPEREESASKDNTQNTNQKLLPRRPQRRRQALSPEGRLLALALRFLQNHRTQGPTPQLTAGKQRPTDWGKIHCGSREPSLCSRAAGPLQPALCGPAIQGLQVAGSSPGFSAPLQGSLQVHLNQPEAVRGAITAARAGPPKQPREGRRAGGGAGSSVPMKHQSPWAFLLWILIPTATGRPRAAALVSHEVNEEHGSLPGCSQTEQTRCTHACAGRRGTPTHAQGTKRTHACAGEGSPSHHHLVCGGTGPLEGVGPQVRTCPWALEHSRVPFTGQKSPQLPGKME